MCCYQLYIIISENLDNLELSKRLSSVVESTEDGSARNSNRASSERSTEDIAAVKKSKSPSPVNEEAQSVKSVSEIT